MMVLGVNSKRQRRPNVRLGEIGDVSAAISCRRSWNSREQWEEKELKHEQKNSKEIEFHVNRGYPLYKSDFTDFGPGISPRLDTHNRENMNPNSIRTAAELTGLETDMNSARLDLGKVIWKGRPTKRRGRSTRQNSIFGSAWNSRVASEIINENGKGDGYDALDMPVSNGNYNVYTIEEFKDLLGRETSDMSKHTYELVEPTSEMNAGVNSDEFWTGNACQQRIDFSSDDGHHFDKVSEFHRKGNGGAVVHDVRGWLEEMGFGKYAGMFEMHEVDGEVLPLLTFEDLKEMGVNAVGTRRKMFTAIQHLKDRPD